jgi:hypothetical protein
MAVTPPAGNPCARADCGLELQSAGPQAPDADGAFDGADWIS